MTWQRNKCEIDEHKSNVFDGDPIIIIFHALFPEANNTVCSVRKVQWKK